MVTGMMRGLLDRLDTAPEAASMSASTGTVIERVDVLVLRHTLSRTRYFSTGSNVTRDSVVVRMADRRRSRRAGARHTWCRAPSTPRGP